MGVHICRFMAIVILLPRGAWAPDAAAATKIWLTGPGASSAPPATEATVSHLARATGTSGAFLIWAVPEPGETLSNWSLNVRATGDYADAVQLNSSVVAYFN